MRPAQFFKRQGGRQSAGIPDFKPILEEHDLYAGIAGVVAMHNGIDDGFSYNFLRNFVFRWHLGAFRSCSHPEVYLGEHKILGLIHEIENRAFVYLIGWNGFCHFIAVEMGAFHLGGDQKTLRLFAEQQHSGIGRPLFVEQVEMLQHLLRRRIRRQREVAASPCEPEKTGDFFFIEVIERSIAAIRGIERSETDQFVLFKNSDETRIDCGNKLLGGVDPTPDKAAGGLIYQCSHFRMPNGVIGSLDIDQTILALFFGPIELPVCR